MINSEQSWKAISFSGMLHCRHRCLWENQRNHLPIVVTTSTSNTSNHGCLCWYTDMTTMGLHNRHREDSWLWQPCEMVPLIKGFHLLDVQHWLLRNLCLSVCVCSQCSTAFPVLAFDKPMTQRHGRFYYTRLISVILSVTWRAKVKVLEITLGTLMHSCIHWLSIKVPFRLNINEVVIHHLFIVKYDS